MASTVTATIAATASVRINDLIAIVLRCCLIRYLTRRRLARLTQNLRAHPDVFDARRDDRADDDAVHDRQQKFQRLHRFKLEEDKPEDQADFKKRVHLAEPRRLERDRKSTRLNSS